MIIICLIYFCGLTAALPTPAPSAPPTEGWNPVAVTSVTQFNNENGFGVDVSHTDHYAIVGSGYLLGNPAKANKAWIFARNLSSGGWNSTPVCTIDKGEVGFGCGVSITDNFAAIGSNRANKAYIYARDTESGLWECSSPVATIDKYSSIDDFGYWIRMTDSFLFSVSRNTNTALIFARDISSGNWGTTAVIKYNLVGSGGYHGLGLAQNFAAIGDYRQQRAYIYAFDSTAKTWGSNPVASITDYNSDTNGRFGIRIAMTDDFMIVGADIAKKAYVFGRNTATNTWGTSAIASITGYTEYTGFGWSLDMTNYFAIVAGRDTKKAFIFGRHTTTGAWGTTAITTIDGYTNQLGFGSGVSITNSFALVGAGYNNGANSAYFFKNRNPNAIENPIAEREWDGLAEVPLTSYTGNGAFGVAVGMTDNYAIVGASLARKVFIFSKDQSTGIWSTDATVIDGYTDVSFFGYQVSLNDNFAIVGAPSAAKVFIFARTTAAGWSSTAVCNIIGYTGESAFGRSVSITDNYALVGAYLVKKVWLFARDTTTNQWGSSAVTAITGYTSIDRFGHGLSLSKDYFVTSSHRARKAFIFARDPVSDSWGTTAATSILGYTNLNSFGYDASITENYCIVGASGARKALIFGRDAITGAWSSTAIVIIDGSSFSPSVGFGIGVSISDNFALVGDNVNKKAYLYTRNPTEGWETVPTRSFTGYTDQARFGYEVSVTDHYALVGAGHTTSPSANTAFIFKNKATGGAWNPVPITSITQFASKNGFGHSVAMNDNFAIVAAGYAGNDQEASIAVIFARNPSTGGWDSTPICTIDAYQNAQFGLGLSITDQWAAVGSFNKVWIFANDASTGWSSTAKTILSGDATTGANFGRSVCLNDNYLLVWSQTKASFFAFDAASGTWGTSAVASIPVFGDSYGKNLVNRYAFIVAFTSQIGKVYALDVGTNTWNTNAAVATLEHNSPSNGRYGIHSAMNDNFIIVGADVARKAFIYSRNTATDTWNTQPAAILSSSASQFGYSCDITDNYAIVSGRFTAKAFIYARDPKSGTWGTTAVQVINPPLDGTTGANKFGAGVTLTDSYALVGAGFSSPSANKAYFYKFNCEAGMYLTPGGCRSCPNGKFSSAVGALSVSACIDCRAGKYSTSSGTGNRMTVCELCPAGKYAAAGADSCRDCSTGKYSVLIANAGSCSNCPAGRYSHTQYPSTSISSCKKCGLGKYSTTLGAISESVCTSCPSGRYSAQEGLGAESMCTLCPEGKYSSSVGVVSESGCIKCARGSYASMPGVSKCTGCKPGKYNEITESKREDDCQDCVPGKYSDTLGAWRCNDCPPGSYGPDPGFNSSAMCIKCDVGKYNPNAGVDSEQFCKKCESGKHSYEKGSIDCNGCSIGKYIDLNGTTPSCIECDSGKFSNGEAEECTLCAAGRYTGGKGYSICQLCAAGRYTNMLGSSSCNGLCPSGKYSSTAGSTSLSDCIACNKGTAQFLNGSATCTVCSPGSYANKVGMKTCSLCQKNTYSGIYGAVGCAACPAGKVTSNNGSIACTSPVPCQAGQYSVNGNTPCLLCPVGKTSISITKSKTCIMCETGKASLSAGQASCQSCGDSSIPNSDKSACTPCGTNEIPFHNYTSTISSCEQCGKGKEAVRGRCQALLDCQNGQYSDSGFSPCLLCPPGKTSSNITRSTTCLVCGTGKVSQSAGQATCQSCGDMEIPTSDGTACVECGDNEVPVISIEEGKSSCVKCGTGELAVRGECTQLSRCNPGEYSDTGYGPFCTSCPQGRYSSKSGTKGAEECSLSPYGTYAENNGNVNPRDCDDNQYTLEMGSVSKSACLDCPADLVPSDTRDGCTSCMKGEVASNGKCLKDASLSQESQISGVFENEGTPFYVMVITVLLVALLSLMAYNSKGGNKNLLQQSLPEHASKFALNCAGIISEFILMAGVLGSGLPAYYSYGLVLLFSRILIASPPGILIAYTVFCSSKTIDPKTNKRTLKYYLDADVVTKNSKTFLGVIALGLLEPTLLSFLPWYHSSFSETALFPNLYLMRMCYFFKVMQLMTTLVAQVGLLILEGKSTSSTIGIIIAMNVALTCANAAIKGLEIFMKMGILRGTSRSKDSIAARRASGLGLDEEGIVAAGGGEEEEEGGGGGVDENDGDVGLGTFAATTGGDSAGAERTPFLASKMKALQQELSREKKERQKIETWLNSKFGYEVVSRQEDSVGDSAAETNPMHESSSSSDSHNNNDDHRRRSFVTTMANFSATVGGGGGGGGAAGVGRKPSLLMGTPGRRRSVEAPGATATGATATAAATTITTTTAININSSSSSSSSSKRGSVVNIPDDTEFLNRDGGDGEQSSGLISTGIEEGEEGGGGGNNLITKQRHLSFVAMRTPAGTGLGDSQEPAAAPPPRPLWPSPAAPRSFAPPPPARGPPPRLARGPPPPSSSYGNDDRSSIREL
jgi:hypothetical protein